MLPGALGEYPRAHELFAEVLSLVKETYIDTDQLPFQLTYKSILRVRSGGLTLSDPTDLYLATDDGARQFVRDLGEVLKYLVVGTDSRNLPTCSANFKDLLKMMTHPVLPFTFDDVESHMWVRQTLDQQGT